MIITRHGSASTKDPLFKGVSTHQGKRLTWFGWTAKQVQGKEQEWLLVNSPVGAPREREPMTLRVINGSKGQRLKGVSQY